MVVVLCYFIRCAGFDLDQRGDTLGLNDQFLNIGWLVVKGQRHGHAPVWANTGLGENAKIGLWDGGRLGQP